MGSSLLEKQEERERVRKELERQQWRREREKVDARRSEGMNMEHMVNL
jgi:hypothetical protein